MEEIIWFKKESLGNPGKSCDVTVTTQKDNKVRIIIRNGFADEIAPTEYMRIGLSPNDKNRLYFMAANDKTGWKLSKTANSESINKGVLIGGEKAGHALRRFDGDYNLEISEDNIFFIDRRNVI